jgi:hypothetical protein
MNLRVSLGIGSSLAAIGAAVVAGGFASPASAGRQVGAPTHSPLAYGWPVRPFHRPHPVRGNFGDPRTIYWGLTSDLDQGGFFQFHNGVDISAASGTAVYPVVSGRVRRVFYDWVGVASAGRRFQYWHIRPSVRVGQLVSAGRTVLGYIVPGAGHVHLTEIDGTTPVNPLQYGHLTPYWDRTPPVIRAIVVRGSTSGALGGRIWFVVNAYDLPSITPPAPWGAQPVTPAEVSWTLRGPGGRTVIPPTVAADFRFHLPPRRDFWHVYATRTRQNQPTIAFTHQHEPGRYFFDLTPGGLRTASLPTGRYSLTVTVTDIRSNRSERTRLFTISRSSRASLASVGRFRGRPASRPANMVSDVADRS